MKCSFWSRELWCCVLWVVPLFVLRKKDKISTSHLIRFMFENVLLIGTKVNISELPELPLWRFCISADSVSKDAEKMGGRRGCHGSIPFLLLNSSFWKSLPPLLYWETCRLSTSGWFSWYLFLFSELLTKKRGRGKHCSLVANLFQGQQTLIHFVTFLFAFGIDCSCHQVMGRAGRTGSFLPVSFANLTEGASGLQACPGDVQVMFIFLLLPSSKMGIVGISAKKAVWGRDTDFAQWLFDGIMWVPQVVP